MTSQEPTGRLWSRRRAVGLAAVTGAIAGTGAVGVDRLVPQDAMVGAGGGVIDAIAVGCDPTGSTESTDALRNAIRSASAGPGATVVFFPPGRYRVAPGTLRAPDRALVVLGDSPAAVTIEAVGTGADPLITLSGLSSRVSGVQLHGRESSGPLIAVDASYCTIESVVAVNAGTSAIEIGFGGKAIVVMVRQVVIRSARMHGIATLTTHPSTDCMFTDIDIGRSGAAGMRLESGGQICTSVHVWASGRNSDTSTSGFEVVGKYCQFDNCQSETNNGAGMEIATSALSTTVTGGRFWGNGTAGIDGGADHVAVSGSSIYRNGWAIADRSSPDGAGVVHRAGAGWRLAGLNIWEDALPVLTLDATTREPRPIVGRVSGPTQTYAVADVGAVTDLSLVRFGGSGWSSGASLYRAG